MTTAVATNFQVTQFGTFKTTDIPTNCMEGLSYEDVETILTLASDGTLWNSTEDFKCAKVDAAGKKTKKIANWDWIIVNPNDPHIIDIGKYAVTERNKQAGCNLEFMRVDSGLQLHILAFNFYALIIQVKDGQIIRNAKALIFEAPFGYKKLLFWMN